MRWRERSIYIYVMHGIDLQSLSYSFMDIEQEVDDIMHSGWKLLHYIYPDQINQSISLITRTQSPFIKSTTPFTSAT